MCLTFPLELEREIILLLKDKHNVLTYALVARHMYEW